jgi:hypothetical protein
MVIQTHTTHTSIALSSNNQDPSDCSIKPVLIGIGIISFIGLAVGLAVGLTAREERILPCKAQYPKIPTILNNCNVTLSCYEDYQFLTSQTIECNIQLGSNIRAIKMPEVSWDAFTKTINIYSYATSEFLCLLNNSNSYISQNETYTNLVCQKNVKEHYMCMHKTIRLGCTTDGGTRIEQEYNAERYVINSDTVNCVMNMSFVAHKPSFCTQTLPLFNNSFDISLIQAGCEAGKNDISILPYFIDTDFCS